MYEAPDLSGVAEPLRSIAERCLDKNPAARPGLDELRRILRELPDTDVPAVVSVVPVATGVPDAAEADRRASRTHPFAPGPAADEGRTEAVGTRTGHGPRRRRVLIGIAAALAVTGVSIAAVRLGSHHDDASASPTGSVSTSPSTATVTLPPKHVQWDYQIGGAYPLAAGARVVSRDHDSEPAPGVYNICNINVFQAQKGEERDWDSDLLLRDAKADVVYDKDWGEAILDIRTAAERQRIAAKLNSWIDECAARGYKAVEPDDYDVFTRFPKYLKAGQAEALMKLLSAHAHDKGLAIAQKNAAEVLSDRASVGLDFAVAEECAEWNECGEFAEAYGDNVLVVEYTAKGMAKACTGWGGTLSIVRRDASVVPKGTGGYVHQTC
ncbi:MAG: hypothetical protein HOY79_45860 [Streptomyces sp.]|nr:hypothetical protein [Streptomyces sp.]